MPARLPRARCPLAHCRKTLAIRPGPVPVFPVHDVPWPLHGRCEQSGAEVRAQDYLGQKAGA